MTGAGFDPASIADLDEPVRRYLLHALAPGRRALFRALDRFADGRGGMEVRWFGTERWDPFFEATVVTAEQAEDLGVV